MKNKIIKTFGLCLLMTMCMAFAPPMSNNNSLYDVCSIENTAFQDGEEIRYKLYYNWNFVWIPAGEVIFKVHDLGTEFHYEVSGKTYSSYEWFFTVRDYYDTYVDKETLLPNTSIRDVNEGSYTLYDKMEFNQDAQSVLAHRGKSVEETVERTYDVEPCMHDMLSIIYYVRNIDFDSYETGTEFPINIFMDKETWPLKVKYKGKKANKKIKGSGRFNTIEFSPEVIAGEVFNDGAEMKVFVSDDMNKIPLLIESPVSVGSVKAVLQDYSGLKYDLSSKVK